MRFFKIRTTFKGVFLIAAGICLAFLPDFISWLFVISGICVILFNGIKLISSRAKGKSSSAYIGGLILGALLIFTPNILSFLVPVLIGIYAAFNGAEIAVKAYERRKQGGLWLVSLIIGSVLFFIGITICFRPYSTSGTLTKLFGIILIASGIFSLVSGKGTEISVSRKNSSVIDIDSFTVKDDDDNDNVKRLK